MLLLANTGTVCDGLGYRSRRTGSWIGANGAATAVVHNTTQNLKQVQVMRGDSGRGFLKDHGQSGAFSCL